MVPFVLRTRNSTGEIRLRRPVGATANSFVTKHRLIRGDIDCRSYRFLDNGCAQHTESHNEERIYKREAAQYLTCTNAYTRSLEHAGVFIKIRNLLLCKNQKVPLLHRLFKARFDVLTLGRK